ncbi:MAG: glutaminyl-peptide cyclotransferase [Sandaracinaceae bacterium]|nr:glutaminyl-peptide cyclotransferase [Myxococcales bacterium]MCB9658272.1 glutaminyl-peptide cyclotransferase [Sandaracinaceae bacterium]
MALGAVLLVLGAVVYQVRQREGEAAAQGTVVQVAAREERPATSPGVPPGAAANTPERLRVHVLRRLPHDPLAFTQGLFVHSDGRVFESTGLNGRSSVREVVLETGEVSRKRDVDARYFAEGLALVGDRLLQLTWQDGVAFEYDLETFAPRRELHYTGEGWGLCYDAGQDRLVMSDGSNRLVFRDPATFDARGEVRVTRSGRPQRMLNELECVDGVVYANVWQTDEIVRIDPSDGEVTAVIDARGLLTPEERRTTDVLNGIAYLPESGHFLITGKEWPAMFEVTFSPASAPAAAP